MRRRKLIAGNWKMNGDLAALAEIETIAAAARGYPGVDVAVGVPATLIAPAAARAPGFAIGAEDVHPADSGAFTGCISAGMVREAGASFAIVGHSERRGGYAETDAEVKGKAEALLRHGLNGILCIGETAEQRGAGAAVSVVTGQLRGSMPHGAASGWLSIAYEPIWAIGSGRTPTPEDAAAIHGAIRATLAELLGDDASAMRILYGGSVTGDNAAALLAADDVDGALVGGASLSAATFVPIIAAAAGLG
ncbi:triose-phosphate isomerase [Sphingomonas sp. H39-1-10]|uniref:triose-phosphate isomerase n=1 Tax=Sphingomonas TaxID=13687 RepID=UPI0008852EF1|nr:MULTISPECIES: triose-phosphate isomerase [Sphingomonas]MDF0487249.1 triose-phosphate isomerase [Sphingomonas pollutisoli]SDA14471.1 triosephosphate isomerase [Sphingomonas sp. NFR15]